MWSTIHNTGCNCKLIAGSTPRNRTECHTRVSQDDAVTASHHNCQSDSCSAWKKTSPPKSRITSQLGHVSQSIADAGEPAAHDNRGRHCAPILCDKNQCIPIEGSHRAPRCLYSRAVCGVAGTSFQSCLDAATRTSLSPFRARLR